MEVARVFGIPEVLWTKSKMIEIFNASEQLPDPKAYLPEFWGKFRNLNKSQMLESFRKFEMVQDEDERRYLERRAADLFPSAQSTSPHVTGSGSVLRSKNGRSKVKRESGVPRAETKQPTAPAASNIDSPATPTSPWVWLFGISIAVALIGALMYLGLLSKLR